jgi:hypothetical protein
MEAELKQPAIQQELPAAPPETGKPAGAPRQQVFTAAPSTPAPPPPAAKRTPRPEEKIPARPTAPETTDQVAPQHVPEVPDKPFPYPAFAPAPRVMKKERAAPAAEKEYGSTRSFKGSQSLEPAEHAMPAAAKMVKKALRMGEHDMIKSEAAEGAPGPPAGPVLQQVTIRLDMISPASAPGSLKEAVIRSGGSVIDGGRLRPYTIKARLPSVRMDELLEQLGRLGRVLERPPSRDLPDVVELEIIW